LPRIASERSDAVGVISFVAALEVASGFITFFLLDFLEEEDFFFFFFLGCSSAAVGMNQHAIMQS
jgi:hypothetical protein